VSFQYGSKGQEPEKALDFYGKKGLKKFENLEDEIA
jgi:hypothetical protein